MYIYVFSFFRVTELPRKMEREREERQEFHLPPQSPNGCNVNTGPGQTQELHPGLPQGQQGLKMLEPSSIGFSDC